jgi:hypothetical protein
VHGNFDPTHARQRLVSHTREERGVSTYAFRDLIERISRDYSVSICNARHPLLAEKRVPENGEHAGANIRAELVLLSSLERLENRLRYEIFCFIALSPQAPCIGENRHALMACPTCVTESGSHDPRGRRVSGPPAKVSLAPLRDLLVCRQRGFFERPATRAA